MDKYQALQQILNDEAKAQEIFTESIEETRENLKKAGLDFSTEELREIAAKATPATADELDADDLDNVSGGAHYAVTGPTFIPIYVVPIIIRKVAKWFL